MYSQNLTTHLRLQKSEPMKTLHLVLTHKWYDMIESGEKREEYRDSMKWVHRVMNKGYTHVRFQRAYSPKNPPTMTFEIKDLEFGKGNPNWGAEPEVNYLVIILGDRL